jgi:hypothetical protein
MAKASNALVRETNTMATKPATIFRITGKMVFVANTMEFIIGTMVFMTITMVETLKTTVTDSKTMVLVSFPMVCKVFTIGYVMVKQCFANPKLVVFGARSPLASLLI